MESEMRDEVHFGRLSLWPLIIMAVLLRHVVALRSRFASSHFHIMLLLLRRIVNVAQHRLIVVLRLYLMCIVASRCRVGMSLCVCQTKIKYYYFLFFLKVFSHIFRCLPL